MTAVVVAAVAVAGCGGSAESEGEEFRVVTTTRLLESVVDSLVPESVPTRSLIPAGADPHAFELSELDVEAAAQADLLVVNGGGLELNLEETLETLDDEVSVFVAVRHVRDPLETLEGELDPHFWHDPEAMVEVVEALGGRLGREDRDRADTYTRRAREYTAAIAAAGRESEEVLRSIPRRRRALVTQHDFFRYFARRFDLTILGTIIPGLSSQDETSATSRTAIVETMENRRVCALFAPAVGGDELSQAVARDTKGPIAVVPVAADTLGDHESYVEAMRANARTVADTLTTCP